MGQRAVGEVPKILSKTLSKMRFREWTTGFRSGSGSLMGPVGSSRIGGVVSGFATNFPWRETNDPYRILVSEMMLVQTTVTAVVAYFERFLDRFPDVQTLANAAGGRCSARVGRAGLLPPCQAASSRVPSDC